MFQPFDTRAVTNTKFLFFTGKGGVGKTSTACASAVKLADEGKRVLLVSTDPASNLQDVLEVELTNTPMPVPGVSNLSACNLDPEEAARAYREKTIGPYRGKLPDSVVATMEEQLSGACTVEIAAFDEFTSLLSDASVVEAYDHIIFDTAPTGHTLRLLQLPTAWSGFLEESTHGASCLGPLSGLAEKKQIYSITMDALADSTQTTLILVARPDESSLVEASRAAKELKEIGIKNQSLIINGLMQSHIHDDEVSASFFHRQRNALKRMPDDLKQVATYSLPFVSYSLTGIKNLRYLFKQFILPQTELAMEQNLISLPGLSEVIEDFSSTNTRVIFTMGKGGVGKTTMASAIAVGLAEKGHKVHLTTTDPAAHLEFVFQNSQLNQNLSISRIDPKKEVEAYKAEVLSNVSGELDDESLAYIEEDLNSPCTEEIAVFRAFAEVVEKSKDEVVVIDTAPSGHTLLLLDAAQSYHKELARSTGEVPESVKMLLPRLRNPKETGVVIVTLAEATPVLEAGRLQDDLKRADITPKWWLINQSLYATETKDPVLKGRASAEINWIEKVTNELSEKCAIVPLQSEEGSGHQELKKFINQ
ncbi:MAG: arsenical pump-driving ATPase [Bacillota bacterium]|jgi:arsenite-transporting ATPase|uniref:Arsenical pump-driving ATPase n=1 Tax=Cytobacillus oceanisediminis 2691 TaxID=1196031 RepID=A0A160MHM4_9BACI|nr:MULTISPECIES: arsenical pump-driving ATPase [Bacillaceae]AND42896.1 arsenical pump-driving ATPase [Cytobacillus oceanisediminis 2691]MBN8202692.1 arsenical pump-driving ATPase [Bacillus sp. NTK034]MCM3244741.1 arsenical pump-driving ATPase [Cytobacillus oceanisediminis]USK47414.1 arsenical pump-driving ATPase [Cytobacillus oceanisediminis]